ncbi:MAG TPA: endolytic transglycosylase MltG [Tissierellaceae bacterium]
MEKASIKKKKRKNRFLTFMLGIILIIVIGVVYIKSYYEESLGPMDKENPRDVVVEIPVSTTTDGIANILYENGLIKNPLIFKYEVRKRGIDSKLKAGEYNLSTEMDLNTIIEKLVEGTKNTNTVRFTIPEGYELIQIAEKLEKEGLINKERFLELANNKNNFEDKYEFLKLLDDNQSLEGFLFPSTYEIYVGSPEEVIIEKMLDGFQNIYNRIIKDRLNESEFTLNEIITLASIVEREAKLDSERPMISAVFHNRLKKDMLLQSCATVQYILGERKEVLTNEDISIQSPYNTYINKGLPPGPIASPGEASIIAALEPADVDYLFFVLTGEDGSHTFSTTYEEHLRAKSKR